MSCRCLRLVGFDDWSDHSHITVYIQSSADLRVRAFRESIIRRVSTLFKAIFLCKRPATPAQSRWTGIPSVTRFVYGLFSFHGFLAKLFQIAFQPSSGGKGKGKGKGKGRKGNVAAAERPAEEAVPPAADADVLSSVCFSLDMKLIDRLHIASEQDVRLGTCSVFLLSELSFQNPSSMQMQIRTVF